MSHLLSLTKFVLDIRDYSNPLVIYQARGYAISTIPDPPCPPPPVAVPEEPAGFAVEPPEPPPPVFVNPLPPVCPSPLPPAPPA
jgi:hypothetical protein